MNKEELKFQLLKDLAIKINSFCELPTILGEAASQMAKILEVEALSITVWDTDTKKIEGQALFGSARTKEILKTVETDLVRLMMGSFSVGSVRMNLEKEGAFGVFSYPIKSDDKVTGCITGLFAGSKGFAPEKDFLQGVLNLLGLAVGKSKAWSLVVAKEKEESEAKKESQIRSERLSAILETAVTVNHQINNPLTAVLGNAQLLLSRGDLDQATMDKLKVIEESALRIKKILQSLTQVIEPEVEDYAGGVKMLNLERSKIQPVRPESDRKDETT